MSKTYISTALRRLVHDRANGACEYCLMPESAGFVAHEVDHMIAEKHGGPTIAVKLSGWIDRAPIDGLSISGFRMEKFSRSYRSVNR